MTSQGREFKREVGAILDTNNIPLLIVSGEGCRVKFPFDFVWQWHKIAPGIIRKTVHTHPPDMLELSEEDWSSLEAWTMALSPFPIMWGVLSYSSEEKSFLINWGWVDGEKRKTYLGCGTTALEQRIAEQVKDILVEQSYE